MMRTLQLTQGELEGCRSDKGVPHFHGVMDRRDQSMCRRDDSFSDLYAVVSRFDKVMSRLHQSGWQFDKGRWDENVGRRD